MRIVLMTALAMVAAVAWADEPSDQSNAADAKTEAAAETKADKPAAQANATESSIKAAVDEDNKPFKPPAGYRAKRVNGDQVYCTKITVLGSRFPKEDCRTEAQLRDLEQQKASMRGEMDQRNRVCASGNGACGAN